MNFNSRVVLVYYCRGFEVMSYKNTYDRFKKDSSCWGVVAVENMESRMGWNWVGKGEREGERFFFVFILFNFLVLNTFKGLEVNN